MSLLPKMTDRDDDDDDGGGGGGGGGDGADHAPGPQPLRFFQR